jgi:short-subunit dehydrogenase
MDLISLQLKRFTLWTVSVAYARTMELRGKRVLITGASRGIGEAFAYAFTGAGATVALVARTEDSLRALAAKLGGTAHPADLSDSTQVATLMQRVEDEAGPIDVLVNNAGIESTAGFTDAPDDELRRVTEVNYLAPAELCRQAIPRMLRRGGGHIVNVSSMAGIAVFPGLLTYSASKAALSHFTAGLRADLRGLPIGTTLVELGAVPTDLLAKADNYEPTAKAFQRAYRLRSAVDVPREKVADEVSRPCIRAGAMCGSQSDPSLSPCWSKCPGVRPKSCSLAFRTKRSSYSFALRAPETGAWSLPFATLIRRGAIPARDIRAARHIVIRRITSKPLRVASNASTRTSGRLSGSRRSRW